MATTSRNAGSGPCAMIREISPAFDGMILKFDHRPRQPSHEGPPMNTAAVLKVEELDAVEEALGWHDGDARATIATLLKDCAFLREQIMLARGAMSHGIARGWLPASDRVDG